VVAVAVGWVGLKVNTIPPLPQLVPQPWWVTRPRPTLEDKTITQFKVDFPKQDIADLKARLSLPPRLTPAIEGANSTYGMHPKELGKVLDHWRTKYDWEQRLRRVNAFSHFKTNIYGLDIHFLRASPPPNHGKQVRPMLLLHGWPGSFLEFLDMIPHLVTPRDGSDFVFEVVVPSIPGYGFSDPAQKSGLNVVEVGRIFVELMTRLGHDKFYSQGGDWGSGITSSLADYFPERLYGIHQNMVGQIGKKAALKIVLGAYLPSGWVMDPKYEKRWYPLATNFFAFMLQESGYLHIQATKPDTVGVGLNASPQGLAAYILEKFHSAIFVEGSKDDSMKMLRKNFPVSLDVLLDNISLYWLTGTITTSMRFYRENIVQSRTPLNDIPTRVPIGIVASEGEVVVCPRNIASAKYTNIVTYTDFEGVGHFAALEAPKRLADDFRGFVEAVEKLPKWEQVLKSYQR